VALALGRRSRYASARVLCTGYIEVMRSLPLILIVYWVWVVDAAAMNTGNAKRDRTMREKVLATDRYPEIAFALTGFTGPLSKMRPGETFTAQVEGTLTVHGHTEPVLLPVDVHVFEDHVLVSGTFPVHWKKYGLADPSFGLVRVKEPLHVIFRLRAVPEKTGDRPPL
jgi:hypothetical protein